jgi:hypothetical protein
MVYQAHPPTHKRPCVVQVNYYDGDIGFYNAESTQDAFSKYSGKIVAIFKPKSNSLLRQRSV